MKEPLYSVTKTSSAGPVEIAVMPDNTVSVSGRSFTAEHAYSHKYQADAAFMCLCMVPTGECVVQAVREYGFR